MSDFFVTGADSADYMSIGTALPYLNGDRAEICRKYHNLQQRYNNYKMTDEKNENFVYKLLKTMPMKEEDKNNYVIFNIFANNSLPLNTWQNGALDTENSDFAKLGGTLDEYLNEKGY